MKIFDAVTLDQNRTSAAIEIEAYESFGIQNVITGATAAGTLAVEFSNDGVTWDEFDNVPVAGAGSSSWVSPFALDLKYLRLNFARTGGTGSITSTRHSKRSCTCICVKDYSILR